MERVPTPGRAGGRIQLDQMRLKRIVLRPQLTHLIVLFVFIIRAFSRLSLFVLQYMRYVAAP